MPGTARPTTMSRDDALALIRTTLTDSPTYTHVLLKGVNTFVPPHRVIVEAVRLTADRQVADVDDVVSLGQYIPGSPFHSAWEVLRGENKTAWASVIVDHTGVETFASGH